VDDVRNCLRYNDYIKALREMRLKPFVRLLNIISLVWLIAGVSSMLLVKTSWDNPGGLFIGLNLGPFALFSIVVGGIFILATIIIDLIVFVLFPKDKKG